MSGTGTAPIASIAPTSLSFGDQTVGTTSSAQTITLTNTGNASLAISSIAASGDFAQTNSCGSSVAASANCAISVTFTPTATGARSASLTITDNASGSPQTIALTGTGTNRVITLSFDPSTQFPNGQIFSDVGTSVPVTIDVANCQNCDEIDITYTVIDTTGNVATIAWPLTGCPTTTQAHNFNLGPGPTGSANVPGPIKIVAKNSSDATITSNILWLFYRGGQPMAAQDFFGSGEVWYSYSGNGSNLSFKTLKFTATGAADGSIFMSGNGIAYDACSSNLILTALGGVHVYGVSDIVMGSAPVVAVDAQDCLAAAAQPTTDTVYVFYPSQANTSHQLATTISLPTGSQPTAIKVLSGGTTIVVYTRGDSTLRWFTVANNTATPAGTLALTFTKTDSAYWKARPFTGGWQIVATDAATSTLGVLGQMVNGDGSVGQALVIVDANAKVQLGNTVTLPAGTVWIAPDVASGTIDAEYPDTSGDTPVMRAVSYYLSADKLVDLNSTSTLVPGVGFLVTQAGKIATFVLGQSAFQPNQ